MIENRWLEIYAIIWETVKVFKFPVVLPVDFKKKAVQFFSEQNNLICRLWPHLSIVFELSSTEDKMQVRLSNASFEYPYIDYDLIWYKKMEEKFSKIAKFIAYDGLNPEEREFNLTYEGGDEIQFCDDCIRNCNCCRHVAFKGRNDDFWTCSNCTSVWRVCPRCNDLSRENPADPAAFCSSCRKTYRKIPCPNCQTEIWADLETCPNCQTCFKPVV